MRVYQRLFYVCMSEQLFQSCQLLRLGKEEGCKRVATRLGRDWFIYASVQSNRFEMFVYFLVAWYVAKQITLVAILSCLVV